mmetsp:Transcript_144241/g.460966  ORF Transcript_144241/g.460966 Transcript_144241/m.460966 type:complete len:139 (-) Transcript_144241:445-861(-)
MTKVCSQVTGYEPLADKSLRGLSKDSSALDEEVANIVANAGARRPAGGAVDVVGAAEDSRPPTRKSPPCMAQDLGPTQTEFVFQPVHRSQPAAAFGDGKFDEPRSLGLEDLLALSRNEVVFKRQTSSCSSGDSCSGAW